LQDNGAGLSEGQEEPNASDDEKRGTHSVATGGEQGRSFGGDHGFCMGRMFYLTNTEKRLVKVLSAHLQRFSPKGKKKELRRRVLSRE